MTTLKINHPAFRNANVFNRTPFTGLFDEFFGNTSLATIADSVPAVNISETDKEFSLEFSAPGFSKENIFVNLENNLLTVVGEVKNEENVTEKNYSRREFRKNSFKRSFTLPENVNAEGIVAKYENGILHIAIQKVVETPENKLKQISVQ